jgi:hypothetical protein
MARVDRKVGASPRFGRIDLVDKSVGAIKALQPDGKILHIALARQPEKSTRAGQAQVPR